MRYMAPEVANGQPYNESCDVYSFSILLWQMLALADPFQNYSPSTIRSRVYNGPNRRPPVEDCWSNAIKICLKRSWEQNLHSRTSMADVCAILRKELVRVRDGDDTGLEHNRRRSTFVFRPNKKKENGGGIDEAAAYRRSILQRLDSSEKKGKDKIPADSTPSTAPLHEQSLPSNLPARQLVEL